MSVQTKNGKAFEYACIQSFHRRLLGLQSVVIEENAPLLTARNFYETISSKLQIALEQAADAAARVIIRLEPLLEYPNTNTPLFLSLQSDASGINGDVRDILCLRMQNSWEIGLSCKHNHHAVKHSRLSGNIDFGKEWFNISCTENYWNTAKPLFGELRNLRDKNSEGFLWSDVEHKNERFYIPLLEAFMKELKTLDTENPNLIPERLTRYLVGKNDFYKIIADDNHCFTRIEAINITGSLNKPSGSQKPLVNVPRLKLPTCFYDISFKNGSNTTIEVTCDNGWSVSMRIHNASSRVEPSLKFDVNLVSLPSSLYTHTEPW